MAVSSSPTPDQIRRVFVNNLFQIDQNLPAWARRSNPLVRRELGVYWRVMPPQLDLPLRAFLVQAVLVLLTIPIPFVMTLILPLVLVSFTALPVALYWYARLLYDLAGDAARSMSSEVENHTLGLLMTTPMSNRQLLLSKLAGALWKQSEPFSLILAAASLTQMPVLFILYANYFPAREFDFTAQILSIIMLALTLIRLPLEMFAVGAMGQWVGLNTIGRGAAQATSLGLIGFYFALLNLPRLFMLDPFWRILIDGVLPVGVAVAVGWWALRQSIQRLQTGDWA